MKVTIDGKDYDLDLEKAKELKLLTEVWKPVKLGDKFSYDRSLSCDNSHFVLCCTTSSSINLINAKNGHRLTEYVKVRDIYNITEQEFKQLTINHSVVPIDKKTCICCQR